MTNEAKLKERTAPGWFFEELPRMGNLVYLIYKDGEVRGQIETQSKEERDQWEKAISLLRKESSPKNSSAK